MGSYTLEEEYKTLHYTGDGWTSVKLSDDEIVKFKRGELDLINLNWK